MFIDVHIVMINDRYCYRVYDPFLPPVLLPFLLRVYVHLCCHSPAHTTTIAAYVMWNDSANLTIVFHLSDTIYSPGSFYLQLPAGSSVSAEGTPKIPSVLLRTLGGIALGMMLLPTALNASLALGPLRPGSPLIGRPTKLSFSRPFSR